MAWAVQIRPAMVVHGATGYVGVGRSEEVGQVEVVLVHAGFDPELVARELLEILGVHIPNPEALDDAMPLVLFQRLDRRRAEVVSRRIRLAGGYVELRAPRQRYVGLRVRRTPFDRAAA